jgi:hypothetical protein
MPKKQKLTSEEAVIKAVQRLRSNLKFYWRTRWQYGDSIREMAVKFDDQGLPIITTWKDAE